MFSAGNFFSRKSFWPKKMSADKFAVHIAEGGSNGGGSGGGGSPPGPSVVRPPKVQKGKVHGTEMFRDKPLVVVLVMPLSDIALRQGTVSEPVQETVTSARVLAFLILKPNSRNFQLK